MSESLGIALIGCGTVGGGVAKILLEHRERLLGRAGRSLDLKRVVVRDLARSRPVELDLKIVGTDPSVAIHDP